MVVKMEVELNKGIKTIIDAEDLPKLGKHVWYARVADNKAKTIKYYAAYSYHYKIGDRKRCDPVFLHRLIIDAPKGLFVDHINGNTLDNRKDNLRLCTVAQNCANQAKTSAKKTSIYKGVYFCKSDRKWRASIKHNRKQTSLGRFNSEIDAAKAYNNAALSLFGEFAHLNVLAAIAAIKTEGA